MGDTTWNTVFDDFEGLMREVLTTGRPDVAMLPSEPPAQLVRDYRTARRVVDRLTARGLRFHFDTETAGADRVRIEVLGEGGHVLAHMSPAQLFNELADEGAPVAGDAEPRGRDES